MAFAIANTRSAPILDRAVSFFADQRAAFAKHRMYMKTLDELKSLSTHELNDLGVSRLSLRDTAYAAVYG